jgi:ATP-dependent DNA ligase
MLPPSYTVPKTFYKMRKDGHAAIWIIYIDANDPDTVRTEHGIHRENGEGWTAVTPLTQRGRNIGKRNYKSPAMVAQETYKKLVKDKTAEGYKQIADADLIFKTAKLPAATEAFPYMLTLDVECPSFRAPKPQNTLKEGSKLWKLAMAGTAMFVRKMDGYGFIVVKDDDFVDAFTLKMQRVSSVDNSTYLSRMRKLDTWFAVASMIMPDKSMLFGEVVPVDPDNTGGLGSYQYVTSILKSRWSEAVEKQEKYTPLGIYLWDVAFWGGIPVSKLCPYQLRYDLILDLVQSVEGGALTDQFGRDLVKATGADIEDVRRINCLGLPGVQRVVFEPETLHIPDGTPDPVRYAINTAKKEGYEGYVVVDPDASFGQKAWSLSGRVERSAAWAKLKPKFEDDFIVRWNPEEGLGEYGNGANFNRIGAVELYQWDGDDLRHCGQCGQGFTESQRERFMDLLRTEPQVFQVEFHEWTAKGKLRIPVFGRHRTDKDIIDCNYSGPS